MVSREPGPLVLSQCCKEIVLCSLNWGCSHFWWARRISSTAAASRPCPRRRTLLPQISCQMLLLAYDGAFSPGLRRENCQRSSLSTTAWGRGSPGDAYARPRQQTRRPHSVAAWERATKNAPPGTRTSFGCAQPRIAVRVSTCLSPPACSRDLHGPCA